LLLTLGFSSIGSDEYKRFLDNEKEFLKYEKNKTERFITYDQYGGHGFKVLYKPGPLIVFFGTSKILQRIESNCDVSEIINIQNIYKGRSIFVTGNYKNFSGVFFLIATFIMLYMGVKNFKINEKLKSILTKKNALFSIINRLIILDLYLVAVFISNYFLVKFKGITLSSAETNIFIFYCLYTIIFLNFFYMAGLLISTTLNSNKEFLAAILWILFIFTPEIYNLYLFNEAKIIPSNESVNINKFKTLMDTEKKIMVEVKKDENSDKEAIRRPLVLKYLKEGHKENFKKEGQFNAVVQKIIKKNERYSFIFPSTCYIFLTEEISTFGYSGYSDFMNYMIDIRDKFMKFYIHKRYEIRDSEIESFVKGEENVFKAQSRLPETFAAGVGLSLLYSLVLFLVSFIVLSGKLRVRKVIENPRLDLEDEEGEMYFILCENDTLKKEIFEFYEGDQNTICINNIKGRDFDFGLSLAKTIKYFCHLLGVEEARAIENLEIFGLYNIAGEKKTDENVKKIYCAVCFAKDVPLVVINDFIDRESRDFERKFLGIIEHAQEGEKTVIYLSNQIYYFDSPFTGDIKVNKFKKFKIEKPSSITIR
jgi:hypothetical protein